MARAKNTLKSLGIPKTIKVGSYRIPTTTAAVIGGGGFYYLGSVGKLPTALQQLWDKLFGGGGGDLNTADLAFAVDNVTNPQPGHHALSVQIGDTIKITYTFKYRGPAVSGKIGLGTVPQLRILADAGIHGYGVAWLQALSLPETLDWVTFSKVHTVKWITGRNPPFTIRGHYKARSNIVVGGVIRASSPVTSKVFYWLPAVSEWSGLSFTV